MSNMRSFYKRFNIETSLEDAQTKFTNKLNNILLGSEAFSQKSCPIVPELPWRLCNTVGLDHSSNSYLEAIFKGVPFREYLLRVQCLLEILFKEKGCESQYALLVKIAKDAIETSPFDLGIRIRMNPRKVVQICFSGSKLLDQGLIDEVLGVLNGESTGAIKLAFEKGLKEFLESTRDHDRLKNALRDMQLACDETVKFRFKDANLGLKHFFKDDRWKKVGFNDYQKQIFWNFNEFLDKLVKHKADSRFGREDVENVIYLAGMFIRLVILKMEKS